MSRREYPTEHKKQMSQNRSTLYQYFYHELGLPIRHMKIGRGTYKVFLSHDDWDKGYLLINDMRVTDFQAVILFTNELVVRFNVSEDMQINIPYKSIKYIEAKGDLNLGYQGIHLNE